MYDQVQETSIDNDAMPCAGLCHVRWRGAEYCILYIDVSLMDCCANSRTRSPVSLRPAKGYLSKNVYS